MSSTRYRHICYFADIASIHTQRWVNYFADRGWKVDVITWHRPPTDLKFNPNITIHRIFFPPHYFARWGALLEITLLLRKIKPDIIHAHFISYFGILAALYSRFSGFRPIVLTSWGALSLRRTKGFHRWLVKYALKRADCVHCDGLNMVKLLTELGAPSQKIKVFYFGTDTQKFKPKQKNKKLREELGIFDLPTIISLRTLKTQYDIGSLITAIPMVLKEVPEAKFVIAGSGPQEAELKRLAKSLGVSDSIRFVGFIPNDDLPKYLTSADVYVSTSLSDAGLAASTAEAMACELPVVITDFGDNRKWVEDGVNGFIVPLKDSKALAEKIIYLLKNEDVRKEFGKKNRQIIEERNNYYKEMEKMASIYIELIKRYKS